ncbi:MAG: Carboxy-terminal domain (CTD) phosphatase [Geoglossum simile]|nr:MAG: Carboxy-terminal domain (CTD) phosphatase [Geoglossum simile]
MRLLLPKSLHYPITVTELLKQPNDNVKKSTPLFSYFYQTTVTEGNRFGEEHQVERKFPTMFESPVEGVVRAWKINKGTVIRSRLKAALADKPPFVDVAEIEEPCSHSVQFGGLCSLCGKDMTEVTYNTDYADAKRATINMIHDNMDLTVSADEAARVEEEVKRRLLQLRKLSLVVDLDQTIIHATVDPTVEEWQKDVNNPNYEAVKDVQAFKLMDEGPSTRGCWYYIKLRPGLKDFLQNVSKLYELHIYTMGTRAYAKAISKIVDPERKIFGDRILSRDESGSLTAKNLQRLFPVDTNMVVIIDDRGDVWKWSDNLIKVTPYDFFVGIGDINSSFLPKKQDFKQSVTTKPTLEVNSNGDVLENEDDVETRPAGDDDDDDDDDDAEGQPTPREQNHASTAPTTDNSALEQLVSMSGGGDPNVLQEQASKQTEELEAQLHDRPLLQKQKLLDAEGSAADQNDENRKGEEAPHDQCKQRHHLLQDNDVELIHLEQSLASVHRAFFQEYDKALANSQGGRVAELRGGKNAKKLPLRSNSDLNADLQLVPDIKTIMPQMKLRVLEGVVLVFSGVIPLGADIQSADIANWSRGFGARIFENVNRNTTHLVAARNRTAKVRQAARYSHVKIVTTQWLFDSMSQWQRLDEEPYLIPVHPDDRGEPASTVYDPQLDDGAMLSSDYEGVSDENGVTEGDTEGHDGVAPSSENIDTWDLDWSETNKELDDWLGSEAGDSDVESIASGVSDGSLNGTRKRKRSASPSADGDTESDNGDGSVSTADDLKGSRLAKRQLMARNRTTSLKEVATVTDQDSKGSSLPSPEATGEEDDQDQHIMEEEDTSFDDELQKELEAELEADMLEGDSGGG